MGVFTRVRDIINSNINSMLDHAENPEKLVKLMIHEMEDTLVEIKASCAGAMASRKKVLRALEEARDRADAWGGKAELAVSKGREDLAREALMEKKRYLERVRSLDEEAVETQGIVEQYQEQIVQIESKLEAVREKQRLLVQRHVHARQKRQAQEEIRRFETADLFTRFEQFEQRIERMEADADLVNYGRKSTLEEEFARLEEDEEIERELQALKKRRDGADNEERQA